MRSATAAAVAAAAATTEFYSNANLLPTVSASLPIALAFSVNRTRKYENAAGVAFEQRRAYRA